MNLIDDIHVATPAHEADEPALRIPRAHSSLENQFDGRGPHGFELRGSISRSVAVASLKPLGLEPVKGGCRSWKSKAFLQSLGFLRVFLLSCITYWTVRLTTWDSGSGQGGPSAKQRLVTS